MDPHEVLRRLRDDDDRWDDVEYRPPVRQPRPQPSPWRRVALAVVAGLAVGAAISGLAVGLNGTRGSAPSVSSSPPAADSAVPTTISSPAPMETGEQLNAEFLAAARDFPRPLADGFTYPTPEFANDSDMHAVGLGDVMVADFWVCTWENAYLTAADAKDASAMKHALAQIDYFAGLPIVAARIPEWQTEYKRLVVTAKNGDLAPLRDAVAGGSCPVMGQ